MGRDKNDKNKSIQNSINEFGEINRDMLDLFLKERDMTKVDDLDQIQRNQRISYINDRGLFRSGGIVITNDTDFFVVRCFNGMMFSLQKNTIEEAFVGKLRKLKKKEKTEHIIKFKPLGEVTKNPLIINDQVLKYFDKKSRLDKFLLTKKYKKLVEGAKWEFSTESEEDQSED